jgi:hypothetical protein
VVASFTVLSWYLPEETKENGESLKGFESDIAEM